MFNFTVWSVVILFDEDFYVHENFRLYGIILHSLCGFFPRLFGLYMFMHHRMHSKIVPVKIFYHVGGMEALLGWVSVCVCVCVCV